MSVNIIQIILVIAYAFIAGMGSVLDEFQTHRPLVACTVIGLILGDVQTGIILGGSLELLALGWMNIGAALAPDAALASVASAVLVIASGVDIKTAITIAVPLAAAGQVLTIFARTIVVGIVHKADSYAEKGDIKGVGRMHLVSLAVQGLRIAIPVSLLFTMSPEAIQGALSSLPEWLTNGLSVAGGFIVVVGYAMVINMISTKHLLPFFFLGFAFAAISELNLIALGMIGLIIALVYIQLSPKYNRVAGVSASDGASVAVDEFEAELEDL